MIILELFFLNPVTTILKIRFFFVFLPLKEQVYSSCSVETDFEINMLQVGFLNISPVFPANFKISYIRRKPQHVVAKLPGV